MKNPETGGAYLRDPDTGQLTLVEQTQPASAGFFTPAENAAADDSEVNHSVDA